MKNHGFALPTAIFLLVILAALGGFILTVSNLQHRGLALDVLSGRAMQAAKAGIEYGAYQTLVMGSCPPAGWTFSPGGGLAAFTVTVTCLDATADEAGTARRVFSLVATACNQPTAGFCPNGAPGESYVERQLQATVGG
jgi:MSHA biogenesis protein MshP